MSPRSPFRALMASPLLVLAGITLLLRPPLVARGGHARLPTDWLTSARGTADPHAVGWEEDRLRGWEREVRRAALHQNRDNVTLLCALLVEHVPLVQPAQSPEWLSKIHSDTNSQQHVLWWGVAAKLADGIHGEILEVFPPLHLALSSTTLFHRPIGETADSLESTAGHCDSSSDGTCLEVPTDDEASAAWHPGPSSDPVPALEATDFMTWLFVTALFSLGGGGSTDTDAASASWLQELAENDVVRAHDCLAASPGLANVAMRLGSRSAGAWYDIEAATLHRVAAECATPVVETLLRHCPEHRFLADRDQLFHRTALHMAAEAGSGELVDTFLQHGADPRARDVFGWTPAHLAARGQHSEIVRRLHNVEGPADRLRDWLGRSADDMLLTPHDGALPTSASSSLDKSPSSSHTSALTEHHRHLQCPQVDGELASDVFLARYVAPGHPVLIKGGALRWKLGQLSSLSRVNTTLGTLSFHVSPSPYSSIYGASATVQTLSDFLEDMPRRVLSLPLKTEHLNAAAPSYLFAELDAETRDHLSELLGDALHPALLRALPPGLNEDPVPQLFLGPALSGAPMHFHQDALNALIFGRKSWWLVPPAQGSFSTFPALQWYREWRGNSSGRPLTMECVQEAGDIMYVPAAWGHALLNLEPTFGVATNFYHPFSTW